MWSRIVSKSIERPSGSRIVRPPTCWCHEGVSMARNTASVPVKRFMASSLRDMLV